MTANTARLWDHLKALCVDIGPRLSGTPADERAVEYIAGHFRRCGAQVEIQDYPCPGWDHGPTELTLYAADGPETLPAFAQTFTGGCDIEAELVGVGTLHESVAPALEGKVLVLYGEALAGLALDRNPTLLIAEERRVAALIVVSPDETVSTKLIRDPFLRVPAAAVSYSAGLKLRENEGRQVRLRMDARRYDSTGHNVIGRLAGEEEGHIVVAAHYDTAADSPGATDNASGTAVVLELCELFATAGKRRFGIEFVAYGAEEYGRYGSRGRYGGNLGAVEYVRRNPVRVQRVQAVIEPDCVGTTIGPPRLWRMMGWPNGQKGDVLSIVQRYPRYIVDKLETAPGPFHLPGVPSLNFANDFGTIPIHTALDTIDLMSPDELAFTAEVIAAIVDHLV